MSHDEVKTHAENTAQGRFQQLKVRCLILRHSTTSSPKYMGASCLRVYISTRCFVEYGSMKMFLVKDIPPREKPQEGRLF